jgi:hypothetical protein
MSPRPRVLVLLQRYPQLSETYIKTELEALQDDFQLEILGCRPVELPDPEHLPFEFTEHFHEILNALRAFKPKVIHSHYLVWAGPVFEAARAAGVPFTLRAHSFDTAWIEGSPLPDHLAQIGAIASHELCLGILGFPYSLPLLERLGVPRAKLHPAPPVVNTRLFHDPSPNGEGVLNTGSVFPKKQMQDFIAAAVRLPGREFNLYPLGYDVADIEAVNRAAGNPVRIHSPVPFRCMPAIYKAHQWLLYTASFELKAVGWPMAVAEAQAAGVGVCMAGIRPDLEDYLGGGGFVYRSIEEAVEILRGPCPPEIRARGFDNARRLDFQQHRHRLTDLWAPVL